jgi:tritrans,polycis-undecaprenyl-diphosphate synthase [geranylgeranyl-diphosphate specific]
VLQILLRILGIYKIYEKILYRQIKKGPIPKHVGIILDGNRRWASAKSYPRWVGHAIGAETAEQVLDWCNELGIEIVTLYALSTENLQRDKEEVKELFELFEQKIKELINDSRIYKNEVRVKAIGKLELLPDRLVNLLKEVEERTKNFSKQFLNIAIAYGGRQEIVDGVKRIAQMVKEGKIVPEKIDHKTIESTLYTSYLPNPEPDLIVRTSGEERLSGFLLWQSAYSELVFMDVYWPDFRKIDLMRAIRTYQKRKRRFGK